MGNWKVSVIILCWPLYGCMPKIEVAAKEPITINMNVKIEHEIHIKVDKDVERLLKQKDDLSVMAGERRDDNKASQN